MCADEKPISPELALGNRKNDLVHSNVRVVPMDPLGEVSVSRPRRVRPSWDLAAAFADEAHRSQGRVCRYTRGGVERAQDVPAPPAPERTQFGSEAAPSVRGQCAVHLSACASCSDIFGSVRALVVGAVALTVERLFAERAKFLFDISRVLCHVATPIVEALTLADIRLSRSGRLNDRSRPSSARPHDGVDSGREQNSTLSQLSAPVSVRVPGDGTRAVATGMMQSRRKLRPSDRVARLAAADIPWDSNGYGPKMEFGCHSPPEGVQILKKSAFGLMTDLVSSAVCHGIWDNLLHKNNVLYDICRKFYKLDPGSISGSRGCLGGLGLPSTGCGRRRRSGMDPGSSPG